jgi:hypothetical protein
LSNQINVICSSPGSKKIPLRAYPKSNLYRSLSRPTEGRFAIVTDAGRDAVDADLLLTNGTEADGEVVWSCHFPIKSNDALANRHSPVLGTFRLFASLPFEAESTVTSGANASLDFAGECHISSAHGRSNIEQPGRHVVGRVLLTGLCAGDGAPAGGAGGAL